MSDDPLQNFTEAFREETQADASSLEQAARSETKQRLLESLGLPAPGLQRTSSAPTSEPAGDSRADDSRAAGSRAHDAAPVDTASVNSEGRVVKLPGGGDSPSTQPGVAPSGSAGRRASRGRTKRFWVTIPLAAILFGGGALAAAGGQLPQWATDWTKELATEWFGADAPEAKSVSAAGQHTKSNRAVNGSAAASEAPEEPADPEPAKELPSAEPAEVAREVETESAAEDELDPSAAAVPTPLAIAPLPRPSAGRSPASRPSDLREPDQIARPPRTTTQRDPTGESPAATNPTAANPAPTKQTTNRTGSQPPADDATLPLYQRAHRLHFRQRDYQSALSAWTAYLSAAPNGRFATEARYNRALCRVRLGQHEAAQRELLPFAQGRFGNYRQAEAQQLLDALKAPR